MAAVKRRKYVIKSYFDGLPKREDLELVEETLPPLKDGEFLCETEWLSVDPYMRPVCSHLPLGSTMMGGQVAKVIDSKNEDFSVGDYVVGMGGWTDHVIGTSPTFSKLDSAIPSDMRSTALGILGMPGASAYFGFLEVCTPKAGETLVVTGAAGAVGSVVGQIAKIKGCRVVGFAGSDAKVEYLKSLGFDAAYNYKTTASLDAALKEACPNGVDMFFDNVGGDFHTTVLSNMNDFGRVSQCGYISEYNESKPALVRSPLPSVVFKQIRIEGFTVMRWLNRWPEAYKEIGTWMKEGKLANKETVTNGFENMFDAFLGLFKGENTGKAVVKA